MNVECNFLRKFASDLRSWNSSKQYNKQNFIVFETKVQVRRLIIHGILINGMQFFVEVGLQTFKTRIHPHNTLNKILQQYNKQNSIVSLIERASEEVNYSRYSDKWIAIFCGSWASDFQNQNSSTQYTKQNSTTIQ
jgi:hypothetical protein